MKHKADAVITGGSSGLGAAFGLELAQQGLNVLLVGRRETQLATVCNKINSLPNCGSAQYLVCDLSDESQRTNLCQQVRENEQLKFLINNAGYTVDGPFEHTHIDDYSKLCSVHMGATIELTHAAIKTLLLNQGRIINVASMASFIPTPLSPLYGSTKTFILQFSQAIRGYYHNKGLKCIVACPGFIRTDFHKKLGLTPETFYRNYGLFKAHSAKQVAQNTLKHLEQGKALSITGLNYKLIYLLLKLCPNWVLAKTLTKVKKARA